MRSGNENDGAKIIMISHENSDVEQQGDDCSTHFTYTKDLPSVPKNVTMVKIDDGVEEIMDKAFQNCSRLKHVLLPKSLKTIGRESFMGCYSLESIYIPEGVETIGKLAFSCCSSLEKISFSSSASSSLKSIVHAFKQCTSLRSVSLPDSVENMNAAFQGCTALLSITLPSKVTNISFAFVGCTSLSSVSSIPASVTNMKSAFCYCTSLSLISIPNGLTYETQNAFRNCSSLDLRLRNDINSRINTTSWLKNRFFGLSIHRGCYDINIDAAKLSKLVEKYSRQLGMVDAMGFTPLHVLCCNPNVNGEMIQILKNAFPGAISMKNVLGLTPLMIFMRCKGIGRERQNVPSTLCDWLRLGLNCSDLDCIVTLLDNDVYIAELEKRDHNSNLLPFMLAASLSHCELDSIYRLALSCPEAVDVMK
mmetsp:Transcript_21720/g.32540  ORF Transcript_21720/g.32540 Transcript_21720/m.32540 type:complete len:421 (+) Transcript_21720:169-1431(+)|eukprot:CAMPEP_0203673198 /NCGR_PEP_ID=MMETSP0090-20130426/11319_1 /ASSEMBLY_ACC=CAM_ASM_001088 /TAXON_ID=426623 /ORGANISM="Chaetoceros affinis, Strain CCMP159" /LENGTH=420 /DNA_ID=CAMNT_0050538787 /DNA_START=94 /DNA_END=1359 /DNA_ORIENTATION=-